jgi:hypothetical protein
MRVSALDQVEFPLAFPLLDLLFPADRCLDRIVLLKPNQGVDAIARCEAWDGLALVLGYTLHEIGGHANIQASRRACSRANRRKTRPAIPCRPRGSRTQGQNHLNASQLALSRKIELPPAGWIPAFAGMTHGSDGSSPFELWTGLESGVLAAQRVGDRIFEAAGVLCREGPTERAIRCHKI